MKDKILIISNIVLGVYFLFRLVDQSQMISTFPLDFTNDWSSYIAQLHFLKVCGFHNLCSYWYNGFISFQITSPGWFFFALPIYLLIDNILLSTFISLILLYIIGFIILYILGKNQKWSTLMVISFFMLFFANAISIGNFIRLGRIVSLFGFVIFLGIAALIFNYKNKEIDLRFIVSLIILYTLSLISHPQEAVLSSFPILCLFLYKKNKDRIKITGGIAISLLLSSFWLIPFILSSRKTNLLNYQQSDLLNWLFSNNIYLLTNVAAIIIPLGMFLMFYLYIKERKYNKNELIFYAPILILNFLFLFKLVRFIPVLKHLSPDPYITFFLFFTIFFLFNTKLENKNYKNFIWLFLLVIVALSITVSVIKTPNFTQYKDLEREVISVLPYVNGSYIMIGSPGVTSYTKAYYSYAAIYHNISTVSGWYNQIAPPEYIGLFRRVEYNYLNSNCSAFNEDLMILGVDEVIFYGYKCDELSSCGLKEKFNGENVCLFETLNVSSI